MSRPLTLGRVAPLLLGSGVCSLVYQTAWLREFRLVFGASTAASAAVLAIFIGGLGLGGLLLGKRADSARSPLALYGNLELVIAASAAVSPFLLTAVRHLYVATGGSFALGSIGGTAMRLALATLVLAIPTVAMGGTLAAVTRAIATEDDARRRSLAILYGTNTLGAVVGALASTFVLLEVLGTRKTLWVAALVNALIALVARRIARSAPDVVRDEASSSNDDDSSPRVPRWFVLAAAGIVGFAFFLMEMTWFRMLGPILGGTVFTFGLILAIALLGIGIGGFVYAVRPATRPATLNGLAFVCAIEAIGLVLPLALGDRVALAASSLRATSVLGFGGQVAGWAVIAGFVILPAAVASGVQFPMLVNLVGRGRDRVGVQLGLVYATNTVGAIAGSLLGGFVLLPALGAVGCWRLATTLLLLVSAGALALGFARRAWRPLALGATAIVIGGLLLLSTGPTAAWRHGGIGAGRAALLSTPAQADSFIADANRRLVWEAEGVESSVALVNQNGLAFVVNGKTDGNAITDAGTQMMGGLVGALVHPSPKRALVIGLGTGETAGWLAAAPGIEHVDAVELEPAILEVVRRCSPMNRDVLRNPKVSVSIGDAREWLLVTDHRYDIVFSEPSNPYRAGVSSLFTRELYEAVRDRLSENGLFLQWTQSYEVDGATIATIYATLGAVFADVHTFRLMQNDLLFVASMKPIRYNTTQLAERLQTPAMREVLEYAWNVSGPEGFLSHFLGDSRLATELAVRARGDMNTDDRTPIEFAFARSLGVSGLQNELPLRQTALALAADRPPVDGPIDWGRFDELRAFADSLIGAPAMPTPSLTPEHISRIQARAAYRNGNATAAGAAWAKQPTTPSGHFDSLLVADSSASRGELAPPDVEARLRPAEAAFVRARYHHTKRELTEAVTSLETGFRHARTDAFVAQSVLEGALKLASTIGEIDPSRTPSLLAALAEPFSLFAMNEERLLTRLTLAARLDDVAFITVLASVEPHVPRRLDVLVRRRVAYAASGHPLTERAEDDLERFLSGQPMPLVAP